MKGLSVFNKLIFVLNLVFVILLLAACAVPFLSVHFLPYLSFLSLIVPALVLVNIFFFLCWAVQGKKQFIPSLSVLILGYFILGSFVKLNFGKEPTDKNDLKVMSYNVRKFNEMGWLQRDSIFGSIEQLIKRENPDILCFQEVSISMGNKFLDYPYHYLMKIPTGEKVHLGVFSKYPIVASETINYPNSINNGSYVDIDVQGDTLRVFNVHMQSFGITPGTGVLRSKSSKYLIKRVVNAFKQQEDQARMVRELIDASPYKTLLCGDFNNTQFSKIYGILKGDMNDSFLEAGSGYGRTFKFFWIPLRIDFILSDEHFEVIDHQNFDEKLSDHYPITATFRMRD